MDNIQKQILKKSRNAGSTARGFTITGSNKTIDSLIIENAGDNGIWISGSENFIHHIITRYNSDTGIQLSNCAKDNILSYCYSYRNIDVETYGGNTNGLLQIEIFIIIYFFIVLLGIIVMMLVFYSQENKFFLWIFIYL